jgi:arabinose-5-phosphate isomerase
MAERLDEGFVETVNAIIDTVVAGGCVIAIGMGKAGFIGMKFSATLASTGIQSFFVPPADAIHGDLGRFSRGDLVICFSYSGESHEITSLVPRLTQRGCRVLSITRSAGSSLGKLSHQVLEIGTVPECEPLQMAPTASTTVMLGLADALAMALCSVRGFGREDFSELHPGGDLGRQLVTVEKIMRVGRYSCVVSETMSVRDVVRAYTRTEGRPGAAAVVDESGTLCGIFTDGNLRRLLDQHPDGIHGPVRDAMSRSPKTVAPSALAKDALEVLSKFQIDQLLVVDSKNVPVGIIDIQDLVRLFRHPSMGPSDT